MSRGFIPTPFPNLSAWYVKVDGRKIYLVPFNEDEKAQWKRGDRAKDFTIRPEVKQELSKLVRKMGEADANGRSIHDPTPEAPEVPGTQTVADVIPGYLLDKKGELAPKTHKVYSYILNAFQKRFATTQLNQLSAVKLREWGNGMTKRNGKAWSDSYKRTVYKKILQVFNWCPEAKIEVGKLVGLPLPQDQDRETTRPDSTIIDVAEEKIIVAHASPRFRAFFQFAMWTGRRPGEIAILTKAHFTETKSGLALRVKGKNFKKRGRHETIPLSPPAQKLVRVAMKTAGDGLLFPSENGFQFHDQSWNRPLDRLAKKYTVNPKLTMYSCRHTWITRALTNGTSIAVVAMLVGNSIATIEKHYAHVIQDRQDRLFEAAALAVAV